MANKQKNEKPASSAPFGTTQRAYTMRLAPTKDSPGDWKEKLWKTHKAVNEGAQFFGDWVLTLRGGLAAEGALTPEEKRLLALCWFCVESEEKHTEKFRVPHPDKGGTDGRHVDVSEMKKAFLECLKKKGISNGESDGWWNDCKDALTARIRDDSVWVRRWKMYEEMPSKPDQGEIEGILSKFLGKDFLKPSKVDDSQKNESSDSATRNEGEDKKTEKKRKKTHNPSNQARQFCCNWFGEGKGADFDKIRMVAAQIKEFAESIQSNLPEDGKALCDKIREFRDKKKWEEIADQKSGAKPKPANDPALNRCGSVKKDWDRMLTALKFNSQSPDVTGADVSDFVTLDFWGNLAKKAENLGKSKEGKKGKPKKTDWSKNLLNDFIRHAGFTYKTEQKGDRRLEFFYFMAGQGARRVSQTHSWVKIAETSRAKAEATKTEKEGKFSKTKDWQKAKEWLDEYVSGRTVSSNAAGDYAIRKNAIDGWDEVVKVWNSCGDADERREKARIRQDELEKFGDINLFLDLTENDAVCVWKPGTKTEPEILKDYVALTTAEHDAKRFKVPSYRHPDPVNHPVYCEFGNSKPNIEYSWRDNPKSASKDEITKILFFLPDNKLELRWQSKRLEEDFGFKISARVKKTADGNVSKSVSELPRADRLGKASCDLGLFEQPCVVYPFSTDVKDWNARLEIYRSDLDQLKKWPLHNQEKFINQRLRWFLTFSPQLPKAGPWWKYIADKGVLEKIIKDTELPGKSLFIKENRRADAPVNIVRFTDKNEAVTKCFANVNGDYGWLVRPGLGNLPKIRVMGVDLGHRYGAACSVWEQMSEKELEKTARGAGAELPGANTVSFRCNDPDRKPQEEKKQQELICRKLGPDSWNKLERQFVIRLPGEKTEARSLSEWEVKWLTDFYADLGRKFNDDLRKKENASEGRFEVLDNARLALKRHANIIKIYHAFCGKTRPQPGGREKSIDTLKDRADYVESVLELWYQLASAKNWEAEKYKKLWETYVQKMEPVLALKSDEDENEPRKHKKERAGQYSKIAQELAGNEILCQEIGEEFLKLWREEDGKWLFRLKELSAVIAKGRRIENGEIMPKETKSASRKTGGLSLERIATMGLLAKLHTAYAQRPTDKKLRNELIAGKGFPGAKFRDKMERLREDRLKKLSNAVAMAAMGLVGKGKDKVANLEKERNEGSRFAPVHAVCVESLEHYRPEQSRTRRENRALMSWSSGQLQKYLGEACDLNGILLTEVSAAYTSRFCSRCGAPGIRGEIIAAEKLNDKNGSWQRQVKKAEKKDRSKKTLRDEWLLEINGYNLPADSRIPVPVQGGQIFFCSNPDCSISGKGKKTGGIQADFNASANIALRATIDGRWEGKWAYIPVNKDGKPAVEKSQKNNLKNPPDILKTCGPLIEAKPESVDKKVAGGNGGKTNGKDKTEDKNKSVYNVFRDISRGIALKDPRWRYHKEFFSETEKAVIENFRRTLKGKLVNV
ncbi:MAG: type V CRISPR-associated protein Cas12b [Elusimicrobia bacterium]|nr:type V CRISPR-associated protein Cas12b [Elusimicrobiota bacterium]